MTCMPLQPHTVVGGEGWLGSVIVFLTQPLVLSGLSNTTAVFKDVLQPLFRAPPRHWLYHTGFRVAVRPVLQISERLQTVCAGGVGKRVASSMSRAFINTSLHLLVRARYLLCKPAQVNTCVANPYFTSYYGFQRWPVTFI